MEQELVHEQAAAYALDALDDEERESFERHLATCERCRADLGGFRDAAALMAVDVEPVDPPPELRGRILEAARAERPNVVPMRRRRLVEQPLVWFAAAAAAAAVAFAVWGGVTAHDLSKERSARAADRAALAVLGDPGARLTALTGHSGTLAVGTGGRAVLAVSRLEPAPSGKTYEAWVIPVGGKPLRAGVFRGGDGTSTVVLGPRVPRGSVVAVTLEQSGGVDAPTTKPFITGSPAA
jgi:anti-sigma-K factor RskA